jgi:hypothetical protein
VSAPTAVLRIDTSGTAFGSAPSYTDRTSYLMAGDTYAVSIRRGRGDERSDPEPATASFFLKNDTGFWTPGAAAAPANWDVGCPVSLQITANAVTYDRFTGYVDSIEPTWPGGVQSWSVVQVTCSDVMARLGRANPLRSLLQHEMLTDSPIALYPLNEAAGSSTASGIVGTEAVAVRNNFNGGGLCVFGESVDLFDATSGVKFHETWAATGGEEGFTRLRTTTKVPSGSAFSIEVWAMFPQSTTPPNAGAMVNCITSSFETSLFATYPFVNLSQSATSGKALFSLHDGTNTVGAFSAASVCDGGMHHIVGTLASDMQTARVYVDGVLSNSSVAAAAISTAGLTQTLIGGWGGSGPFPGVISHVALYSTELSAARILAHYQAGVGTSAERSDLRFSRIADFGGITTSGLPTGLATMGGQQTAGAPALDSLQLVGRSEGGPVYATRSGALTFQARSHRYNASVALSLAADDVDPGFGVRRDRMELANEVSVNRQAGISQTVQDATSQNRHGRFDGGSFDVAVSTDDDALQAAQWRVATRKDPLTRLPSLSVDLYRQTNTTKVAQLLTADVSTKVQITGLPAQAPSSTFTGFIEGYEESFSASRWGMTFFTSPVTLEDSLLTLDDATKGVLDTYRLGF